MSSRSLPKISVAMANYNHGHCIATALESICTQDYLPHEVLVLDDCSTDNSMSVLRSLQQRFPFLRVIQYPRKSDDWLGAFLDHACALLSGDYFCSLGADDLVYQGFFKTAAEAARLHPSAALIFSNYHFLDDNRKVLGGRQSGVREISFLHGEALHRQLSNPRPFETGIGTLVRKDVFRWLTASNWRDLGPWLDSMGYPLAALRDGAVYLPRVFAGFTIQVPGRPSYHQTIIKDDEKSLHYFSKVQQFLDRVEFRSFLPDRIRSVLLRKAYDTLPPAARSRLKKNRSITREPLSSATWDYVSPGMDRVSVDAAFPYMIEGNREECRWEWFRREIPHRWYVDSRRPGVGFLSRDEAHILYNNALKFRGNPALEVGCWMGWSAVHLILAQVDLTIIDPILRDTRVADSVVRSLRSAAATHEIRWQARLCPGVSPSKIHQVAENLRKPWSFFFIDGDHEGLAALRDAEACAQHAAEDAMVLFHDLAAPAVGRGLDYLRESGWNTMIYQTMQIMGVAWRGRVSPVSHTPDPRVRWSLPPHLTHHPISS